MGASWTALFCLRVGSRCFPHSPTMLRDLFIFLKAVLLIAALPILSVKAARQLSVKIVNNAGASLEVFWIDQLHDKNLFNMLEEPLKNLYSTQVTTFF